MIKLRSLTSAIFITVLSILSGCSDEIISPVSQSSGSEQMSSSENKIDKLSIHRKISLKAHQTIEFNGGNTIFSSFNSISILNCGGMAKNSLEILGYSNDEILVLGCNSGAFFVYSITIENKSPKDVELDVFLSGLRRTKSNPTVNKDRELF